jgi:hypothetical protein
MAVHFLHDHGDCHDHCSAGCAATDCTSDSNSAPHHGEECPGGSCEDSCFACRFLAIQSISPAIVAPPALVAVVELIPEPCGKFVSAERISLPLTRGPPCA